MLITRPSRHEIWHTRIGKWHKWCGFCRDMTPCRLVSIYWCFVRVRWLQEHFLDYFHLVYEDCKHIRNVGAVCQSVQHHMSEELINLQNKGWFRTSCHCICVIFSLHGLSVLKMKILTSSETLWLLPGSMVSRLAKYCYKNRTTLKCVPKEQK